MSDPFYTVRGGRADDANALLDIDIKCFEEAWSPEEWSRIGHSQDHAMAVAIYFGTPIGFGIFSESGGDIQIDKLAVKPSHRLKGVSRLLLASAVDFAHRNRARNLFLVVPESTIYDAKSPYNTSLWAAAVGFLATKPLLKRHFKSLGETEDGVKFVAPISKLEKK